MWRTATLADLLADGGAADGGPGSLCSLGLPGSGSGGPACVQGLTCTRLAAGPLKAAPYGYCKRDGAANGTAAFARGNLGSLPVAVRTAVDGTPCRLPAVVGNGSIYTDCGPIGGSAAPSCFTKGVKQVARCAPAAPAAPTTLGELLASGSGADGQRGSICAVAGAPAVPAPPCDAGLVCRPLEGDYGFCTAPPPALDSGASDAANGTGGLPTFASPSARTAAAMALPVQRRTAVTGLPCRLPVRYKGELLTDCALINGQYDHCFVGDGLDAHQKRARGCGWEPRGWAGWEGGGRGGMRLG